MQEAVGKEKLEEARNKCIVEKQEVGGEDLGWNPLGPFRPDD